MNSVTSITSTSDDTVQQEIGTRLARYRLNKNLTQTEMAEEAGVSRATVARLEKGHSTQLSNFIRVLRALDLLENMDVLIPASQISPMQQLKLAGKQRQRASSPRKVVKNPQGVAEDPAPWRWGNE